MTTRRLAAILAANVVGFSSMMEKDEEGTASRIRAILSAHHGPLVKTTERHHPQRRTELEALLDFPREGETLCVTRVDRIALSVTDLMIIVRILEEKGWHEVPRTQPIDTSSGRGPLATRHD